MKFDCSNTFDLCYYGQVNSLRIKSNVASKWANKQLWGNIYFAGDGISLLHHSIKSVCEANIQKLIEFSSQI